MCGGAVVRGCLGVWVCECVGVSRGVEVSEKAPGGPQALRALQQLLPRVEGLPATPAPELQRFPIERRDL